jgi:glycosyltransferase involved in cell wall biosynthesis
MVRDAASPGIDLLGQKPAEEVTREMERAAFLVMPSEWYEGFPVTLAEAFRQGLPVIASRLGAMAEIVEDGVTGLHFTPSDAQDLAAKVCWAAGHPEEMRRMGANARRIYGERYAPEVNYEKLVAIYQAAIREKVAP